jgi:hypothetical protein
LIGFFSLILENIGLHKDFSQTIYKARKILDIKKKSKTFAICTDCNKLYDITKIILENQNDNRFLEFKCTHIEFPKHPMQKYRKPCESELLMKVPVNNGYIWHPKMLYPLSCLKSQLSTMYQRRI